MTVAVEQFKSERLDLMERVAQTGEEVVITKEGRGLAKLVPLRVPTPQEIFGKLAAMTEIRGDLVAPTGETWEANA